MKISELCWLENWQLRFPYPEIEYGSRRGEVIGTFLAIVERKNCVLIPEKRDNVSLIGNVYNYPQGEFADESVIRTSPVVRIEHKLLSQVSEGKLKQLLSLLGDRVNIDRKERKFATFVTVEGGITYMLGHIYQRLESSTDSTNWDILQGQRGYSPYTYDKEGQEKHFEDYAIYFTDVDECYKPLDLEE